MKYGLFTTVAFALCAHAAPCAKSVRVEKGDFLITTPDGTSKKLTSLGTDGEPSLSVDGSTVVFVRVRRVVKNAGLNLIAESEIRSAKCSDQWQPRQIVQTPLLPEYAGLTTFQQPQLSPDGSAAFILAPQWSAVTGGLLSIETQPGGRAKFLASALRYWIVQKGPWSGNLIVHQNPILVGGGRLEIYYMLDRTGKEIGIVGTSEDSVKFLLAESEH